MQADIVGLSYQISLINVLFPFSPFLHVQSMVVMVRAACLHVICFITTFSIQYRIIFPKGCAIERHWTSHLNKRNCVIISAHYSNRPPVKILLSHINELDKRKFCLVFLLYLRVEKRAKMYEFLEQIYLNVSMP